MGGLVIATAKLGGGPGNSAATAKLGGGPGNCCYCPSATAKLDGGGDVCCYCQGGGGCSMPVNAMVCEPACLPLRACRCLAGGGGHPALSTWSACWLGHPRPSSAPGVTTVLCLAVLT